MPIIYHMPITSCTDIRTTYLHYNAMNNATMTTGMYTYNITGICP